MLEEEFVFDNGAIKKRRWNIEKKDDNQFIGKALDVIGIVRGKELPGEINMRYILKLPMGKKTYNLTVDDRLYMMPDNIVLNKAKMKKFGITVATLNIIFKKI